ncbi:ribosomal protein S18-alanine N-acetyltransferase [Chitinimonas sp. BJYL2]|uniref:ribosomal protein S18-alanine N-acetyltransferase n=1 Tax=Chitinimonas sp. BJYL2 TaxID=2976696 RepID=UPI0022B50E82|nr:ribosomal protein S18-alanine N-acetyltransferase [Chitinimonas sp. BJYL2]
MNPLIEYRPLQAADLPAVAEIETTLQAFPWTAMQFASSLTAGHKAWVGTEQGMVIAYAVVDLVLDELSLLTIGVHPQWQRRGIARKLVELCMDYGAENGAAILLLEVRKSNQAAQALYRRLGFVQTGQRKGYYRAHEGREDAILMALTLDEGGR